jgi:hypothetical protein
MVSPAEQGTVLFCGLLNANGRTIPDRLCVVSQPPQVFTLVVSRHAALPPSSRMSFQRDCRTKNPLIGPHRGRAVRVQLMCVRR